MNYPDKSLVDLFEDSVKEFPNNTALFLTGKKYIPTKITYAELDRKASNFAKNLYSLGVRNKDRIALFLPNFPEFVIAFFGILKLGCIVTPLNIMFSEKELEYHIKDSGANVLVTIDVKLNQPSYLELAHKMKVKIDHLEHIIVASIKPYIGKLKSVIGGLIGKIEKLDLNDIPFNDIIRDNTEILLPKIKIDPKKDVCMIPYTGGTTGTPKGVMLTHWNKITNIYAAYHWFIPFYNGLPPKGKLKFLGALPFFHQFGSFAVMTFGIFVAGEIILIPNPRERNFTELLEIIHSYKPNIFPFVPTGYIALLNHPDFVKYDFSSIDLCFSAAAPIPLEVMKEFEKLTGTCVLEGWGLTETSPIASINPTHKRKIGSVGIPIPDTTVAVFDLEDKNKMLPNGELGELGIKGPQIMKGYWNKPEETDNVMNSQGFFMSGDIGRMDEEGYIYIEDRKKDMIIASGYKVFPREVEEYFFEHPDVENVAVIGIPDKYRGEKPKCFIVLKDGASSTAEELMEYAKKGLSNYKVPSEIEIRPDLPISGIGKVLRRKLRDEDKKIVR